MIFGEFCPVYAKQPGGSTRQPYPGYPGAGARPGPGYPTHNPAMPQPNYPQRPPSYPPQQQQQQQQPPSYTPYPSTPYPNNPPTYQPQPQQQQRQQTANATPPARPPQPSTTRQESVIKEETLRMSLLSTAEDKLKRRVKEVFQMGKVSFIDH